MESFFALLQKDVLNGHRWSTRDELRLAIIRPASCTILLPAVGKTGSGFLAAKRRCRHRHHGSGWTDPVSGWCP
jgi:hypothetical protein